MLNNGLICSKWLLLLSFLCLTRSTEPNSTTDGSKTTQKTPKCVILCNYKTVMSPGLKGEFFLL